MPTNCGSPDCDAVGIERPGADRTAEVAQAFVELAGALVHGYDVVDLLDRLVGHCVQLLEVDAAGRRCRSRGTEWWGLLAWVPVDRLRSMGE